MDRLEKYKFKDEQGHPLENCSDYQDIFYEHKVELEKVKSEVVRLRSALENAISALERADDSGTQGLRKIIQESYDIFEGKS